VARAAAGGGSGDAHANWEVPAQTRRPRLQHPAQMHGHGRGLLIFFDNAGAQRSLLSVARVWGICALADGRVLSHQRISR
jgi:hypothetical protein